MDKTTKTGKPANRKTGKLIAQSSIETTVALVVFFMLFVTAVKVFVFFTERLASRQRSYEDTRVAAGSGPRDFSTTPVGYNNTTRNELVIQNEVMWDEPATKVLHIFK